MGITKKHKQILRSASRKCGMSYRSMANRDLFDEFKYLRYFGFVTVSDNGKDKGRFVIWTTDKGLELLND